MIQTLNSGIYCPSVQMHDKSFVDDKFLFCQIIYFWALTLACEILSVFVLSIRLLCFVVKRRKVCTLLCQQPVCVMEFGFNDVAVHSVPKSVKQLLIV